MYLFILFYVVFVVVVGVILVSSAVLEQKHCACVFVVREKGRELKRFEEREKINKARLSANFDTETIHTKHNLMTD